MLRSVISVAAGSLVGLLILVLLLALLGIFAPSYVPQVDAPINIPVASFILLIGLAGAAIGAGVSVVACKGSRLKHVHATALVTLFLALMYLAANNDLQPLWFLGGLVVAMVTGVYIGGHLANKRFPQGIGHAN